MGVGVLGGVLVSTFGTAVLLHSRSGRQRLSSQTVVARDHISEFDALPRKATPVPPRRSHRRYVCATSCHRGVAVAFWRKCDTLVIFCKPPCPVDPPAWWSLPTLDEGAAFAYGPKDDRNFPTPKGALRYGRRDPCFEGWTSGTAEPSPAA